MLRVEPEHHTYILNVSSKHKYGDSNTKINPGYFINFTFHDQQSKAQKDQQEKAIKVSHKAYKGKGTFKTAGKTQG